MPQDGLFLEQPLLKTMHCGIERESHKEMNFLPYFEWVLAMYFDNIIILRQFSDFLFAFHGKEGPHKLGSAFKRKEFIYVGANISIEELIESY